MSKVADAVISAREAVKVYGGRRVGGRLDSVRWARPRLIVRGRLIDSNRG